ncbi:MAG: cupin domain-containing protein [Planctomycetota bacterium]
MATEFIESMPVAQAVNAHELVTHQAGAVVSRTVLKKATGNVTLFAFAAGEGLSEHTAPFDALVYVLEGEVDITIAGKLVAASAGQLVVMPANQPHALKAGADLKMMLVMIRS